MTPLKCERLFLDSYSGLFGTRARGCVGIGREAVKHDCTKLTGGHRDEVVRKEFLIFE
jgi:hypothetical protein